MDAAIEIPPPPLPPATEIPFALTVDLFSRMLEAALIPRDRRVFLRDGGLYEKPAKTKAHGFVGAAVNRAVDRRLPDGWCLWPESTIVLDAANAPLPDFAVIRGTSPLDYADPERYPTASDVGVVIEVAVASLRDDLTTALELYARASIPAYWVVDVHGRRVLVHTEPRIVGGRGEYARVETYRAGQEIPLPLDGREAVRIPFDELIR
ncbi:MAG: Uma2 family endonuclease [Isosphaeraceae bacterium]|nr:Uma2 family endonuclease [Isosphaeraceae bacterium]